MPLVLEFPAFISECSDTPDWTFVYSVEWDVGLDGCVGQEGERRVKVECGEGAGVAEGEYEVRVKGMLTNKQSGEGKVKIVVLSSLS